LLADLINTMTRDGVRLDGAYHAPPRPGSAGLALDAVCFLHGTGGNFYSSPMFGLLAERLLELGVGVLRANTRGHDLMSTAATTQGARRQGAAYEVVDDCRHDVAAWTAWLSRVAGPRVGLLGHSLGALKCLYAQAHEPIPPAACLIAVSPPRLSHSWFVGGEKSAEFVETFTRARQCVADGRPETLLEVRIPLPFLITAAGYFEKYGPDERYNYLRFLNEVRCPTLLTFGGLELEQNAAFRGAPEEARALCPRHRVETVPGADHFYTAGRDELAARIVAWLRTLSERTG
jgi:pimeloyl-ACP methyl ester carboxylesterase